MVMVANWGIRGICFIEMRINVGDTLVKRQIKCGSHFCAFAKFAKFNCGEKNVQIYDDFMALFGHLWQLTSMKAGLKRFFWSNWLGTTFIYTYVPGCLFIYLFLLVDWSNVRLKSND